ncbi:Carboxylesterase [Penicillium brevicompactum]|uniref:Carboxylesterase n=1 Tax=Penicillium brevicompactum TaxID=5074 RepID=A0A9W9QLU8_PENBR|nr:Carboxylesterase [Penicillium brevicompactum]
MLDQFAVLQWVYNVIQDFGEDPEQIAIAGQSGWTGAVLHQANSPLIKGLLKCAIGEWESRTVSVPRIAMCPMLITGNHADVLATEAATPGKSSPALRWMSSVFCAAKQVPVLRTHASMRGMSSDCILAKSSTAERPTFL